MARTVIARTAVPALGMNLTDATYTTMGVGAGNGIEGPYRVGALLILNNPTGAAVTYTIKVPQPAAFVVQGVVIPDIAVAVGASKIVIYPMADVMKWEGGIVRVDCSAAGKIIVMA